MNTNGGEIIVRRTDDGHVADWGAGPRRCAVGRSGIGEKLREGDGLTPAGRWPLRRILYRADRIPTPKSALGTTTIARDDGWCDAPGDLAYNRAVKLPYGASAEELWRGDQLYDVVVVIGYNDAPVVLGKGSAIFLHVANNDCRATEGCVALARVDLIALLAEVPTNAMLVVKA